MDNLIEELKAEQHRLEGAYNALQKVIERRLNPVPPDGPGTSETPIPVKVKTQEATDGEPTQAG